MSATTYLIKSMDMASSTGLMEGHTRATGATENKRVLVSIQIQRARRNSVNGNKERESLGKQKTILIKGK